ncbi:MAG: rhodanese-like domain-containing protein [Clostridia bacterium]|nr:rhodanese-like domain-containing protein [Clostridia bacterium]MBR1826715.1 rhodanese-like domain-containing protein [Clostridia bacterium]
MAAEAYKRIGAEEFDSLDFDAVTLLDLRDERDAQLSPAPGAINLPLDQIGTRLSDVPKDKPVVVFCKVGLWSEAIAEVLAERGYDVTHLEGGYNSYLGYLQGF